MKVRSRRFRLNALSFCPKVPKTPGVRISPIWSLSHSRDIKIRDQLQPSGWPIWQLCVIIAEGEITQWWLQLTGGTCGPGYQEGYARYWRRSQQARDRSREEIRLWREHSLARGLDRTLVRLRAQVAAGSRCGTAAPGRRDP